MKKREIIKFEISEKEWERYLEWEAEQNEKAIIVQKSKVFPEDDNYFMYKMSWDMGYPYCGAIGGEFSWEFTPTSIGTAITVKNSVTGEEKNITDYDLW